METLATVLQRPRYEVLPVRGVEEQVLEWAPHGCTVTVTASPRRGLEPTLDLSERLARHGYRAVPHLAARQVVDRCHLERILRRLDDAGVREAFVVGGDDAAAAGDFPDALTLLQAMDRAGHHLEEIGIAGYPEGHPSIGSQELDRVIARKAGLASYVVTQMCFDPRTVTAWTRGLRELGVWLPVLVGVAGVVDMRTLLRVASRIGVGTSARFLRRNSAPVVRLLRPGYRPDRLLRELEPALATPSRGLSGVHVYTLGDLAATELWRRRVLCGRRAS